MSEKEVNIIPFAPESGMNVQQWLTHFENSCLSDKKDNGRKVKNIPKVLKGEALKMFVNECLGCVTFEEIAKILTERFIKVQFPSFSDFASLKLNDSMI